MKNTLNNIQDMDTYLQKIEEGKDIIIKDNNKDYDRLIDGETVFNSDDNNEIYFDRISKNLRKIHNTEISRISGDYEDIEDELINDFDIIREDESLYEYIKDVKTYKYIDLSDVIDEKYTEWFNKVLQRHKVGKGEFLLPILFADVYKSPNDKKYDDFIFYDDNEYPIEIKASIQGSWDNSIHKKEPDDKYSSETENEYKTFIAETICNYCKSRRLQDMYLIFFDINLNGILVINTNNSKEELTRIIYECVDIIDNVTSKDKNFNSFCFDKKIKCALPDRNININDDTISIYTYLNKCKGINSKPRRKPISKTISKSKPELYNIQNELNGIKDFSKLSREEQVAYIYFEKKLSQHHSDIADILYGDRNKATTSSKYVSLINSKYGGYFNWLKNRASKTYKDIINKDLNLDKIISLINDGKSTKEIGKLLGHTESEIIKFCKDNDIKINRKRSERLGKEVDDLILKGLSVKEIAKYLNIDRSIVDNHRSRLKKKGLLESFHIQTFDEMFND